MKTISALLLFCVLVGYGSAAPSVKSWIQQTKELVLSLLQPEVDAKQIPKSNDPIPTVAEDMHATEYIKYITKANLREVLQGSGPYTALVPPNTVFNGLSPYMQTILNNQTALKRIMSFNVIKGELKPSMIKNDYMVPTLLEGDRMRMNVYKNGAVMTAAGRVITKSPRPASNGLVYEVQGLPQPPVPAIAEALAKCPNFTVLTKVLKTAGMYNTLNGAGPFTVFAPTDEAFKKIPADVLAGLMKNTTALMSLLKYHAAEGTFYSPAFDTGSQLPTMSGHSLTIQIENGKYMVNTVPISFPDTTTTNGVVHTVTAVLMPPTAHMEMVFMQR